MMYNQKLTASIRVDGKILRELKDTVLIPFGAEYSILIKNLNTVRVIVDVFVDGENTAPGGLVIAPGAQIDLERWIRNGNLSIGNKFKFVNRSAEIENGPRGIKTEDGLVRIEYRFEHRFEQSYPVYNTISTWNVQQPTPYRGIPCSTLSANAISSIATAQSAINDVGITVPGSMSEQKFQTTAWFATEQAKHVIIFNLKGETADNMAVAAPLTVRTKLTCVTCGKVSKSSASFCQSCGTALTLY